MDLGEVDESPSKIVLIGRWLFDQCILPFMEMFFPCDHPDDDPP